jgi:TRAP-type C4-dicarboxylate transport system permease small subunit
MRQFDAFLKNVNKLCQYIASFFLLGSFFIMILQVFTRYFFNFSFPWSEELARFLIIYCVFLTSVSIYRNSEHPKVEILYDILPKRTRYYLNYFFYLIMSAFLIFLVIYGYRLVITTIKPLTPATRIPKAIPFASVLIGSALTLLQTIGLCWDNYTDYHRKIQEV